MDVLLYLLIGVALAVVADRLIARFDRGALLASAAEEDDVEARVESKQLPWQVQPWSDRLRRGVVLLLIPLTIAAGLRFELIDAIAVSLLVTALLICTATDLLRYRVPNAITYPGTLLTLVAVYLLSSSVADLLSAVVAAVLAAAVFLLMAILTRGGLGLGDVKLAMLIGAALGLQSTYQALALGVVSGGVVILALFLLRFIGRRQAVPYAPFLALGAVVMMFLQGPVFAPI